MLMSEPSVLNHDRMPSLSGVRGVAVLVVLMSHTSNHGLYLLPELSFSGSGRYGVYLFFVLSAFLLTRQFLLKKSKSEYTYEFIFNYFKRRFLRIFPLFIVSLCVYWLYSVFSGSSLYITGVEKFFSHLFLVEGVGIFWTIPVEFKYYFLLPLVVLFLVSDRFPPLVKGGIMLALMLISYRSTPVFNGSLIPFIGIFLAGSFAAWVSVWLENRRSNTLATLLEILGWCSAISFFLLSPDVLNLLFDNARYTRTYFHDQLLLFSVVSVFFIFGSLYGVGGLRKVMSVKPFMFMGEISFSLYLWHIIILKLWLSLDLVNESIISFLLFFMLVLMFSYVSYQRLELPCQKSVLLNYFWNGIESWVKKVILRLPFGKGIDR